ncbi:MAG: hypothetical protein GTN78_20925 [Gemmatimonadales bacterium]|nr:hypothetical protein [Gemmatimonadales bacterium]NIN12956.1 hypothetical protein [Gemmatimonadales bacterium]NIR02631.1 hypothetical protein [Gemmatimonadales bacterium]NIS67207.1 hypothetical protein [Gemmatimonadales bacterium]
MIRRWALPDCGWAFRWLSRVALLVAAGFATLQAQRVPGDVRQPYAQQEKPHLLVGIYLASPEEGARVFSAVRMLPMDHPEARGHEYPTAAQFHRSEVDLFIRMGRLAGLGLYATLLRHPTLPTEEWTWEGFSPPPAEIATARDTTLGTAPLPGVRVVAYVDGIPLAFLVDTRGLTLEQRGMSRPTSSGLDVPREDLLRALSRAGETLPSGAWIVLFER